MCRNAFFSHKNQCVCISYLNEYEEANCTESKEKENFFPFERQNPRLAGFGGYLYYVLFLGKRGGSKLSSLDFSLNSHRILRQPNDIPYVKLCYYGEEKRDRISLGSMSGPELTLMSWLAWNSKSSCFHH